jgi:N-acyl-D-amino-acid deacylase
MVPQTEVPEASAEMTCTPAQVEWAGRLRVQVAAEFARVEAAFRVVAAGQNGAKRAETEEILAILEDKRREALGVGDARYFILNWQDLGDQVRRILSADARYQAIRARR